MKLFKDVTTQEDLKPGAKASQSLKLPPIREPPKLVPPAHKEKGILDLLLMKTKPLINIGQLPNRKIGGFHSMKYQELFPHSQTDRSDFLSGISEASATNPKLPNRSIQIESIIERLDMEGRPLAGKDASSLNSTTLNPELSLFKHSTFFKSLDENRKVSSMEDDHMARMGSRNSQQPHRNHSKVLNPAVVKGFFAVVKRPRLHRVLQVLPPSKDLKDLLTLVESDASAEGRRLERFRQGRRVSRTLSPNLKISGTAGQPSEGRRLIPDKSSFLDSESLKEKEDEIIICRKGCERKFKRLILTKHELLCERVFRRLTQRDNQGDYVTDSAVLQKLTPNKPFVNKWRFNSKMLRIAVRAAKSKHGEKSSMIESHIDPEEHPILS